MTYDRTKHVERAGNLGVVLRWDGGIYIADFTESVAGDRSQSTPLRIGSSAVICDALGDALKEMAKHIRAGGEQREEHSP
ncbi:MAG TPA: hypothetical protein VG734_26090 [Lacunisphaera sp.]|nr:hypothetical protein [Lacunisphaera sp.]